MEDYLQQFKSETNLYNFVIIGSFLPTEIWESLPHPIRTWLRNYIGGTLIYFITGSLWCFYIYYLKPEVYINRDSMPTTKTIMSHISISMRSVPWYAVLPTVTEYMIENGYTRCFSKIAEVGLFSYCVYVFAYLLIVEFLTYWAHRELHHIKPLYKHIHSPHHAMNNVRSLSPFAGFALHPLDGILQGSPHLITLFIVPMHFTTHLAIWLAGALWTTNIHDCIDGKFWPILGGGYHIVHHTSYKHNYGLYTIFMDWVFGTLSEPKSADTITMKQI